MKAVTLCNRILENKVRCILKCSGLNGKCAIKFFNNDIIFKKIPYNGNECNIVIMWNLTLF